MTDKPNTFHRRTFLTTAASTALALSAPAIAQDTSTGDGTTHLNPVVDRLSAGFRTHRWQDYFDNTRNGVILVDTPSRVLHFWSEDETVERIYPTSVPLSEDLTRLGRTSVTKKVVGPTWRPTPSMLKRNPEWPRVVGPGPDNPLGSHAMHLSWQYYRIHGTHDTRKIGRKSSNGCIGLYNEDIAELFELTNVGTQVLLI
ncbi:MAG: L,D-transpeptidase [Pseudomonadota bacterium]